MRRDSTKEKPKITEEKEKKRRQSKRNRDKRKERNKLLHLEGTNKGGKESNRFIHGECFIEHFLDPERNKADVPEGGEREQGAGRG